MRWLLLTDLHVGHGGEAQEAALSSLLDNIETRVNSNPCDLVLLAGDLAFSGKSAEYTDVSSRIINPLRKITAFKDARFISVPGNHDVDCELSYAPTPIALGPKKTEEFFHFNDIGQKLRKPRAESFSAYSEFLKLNGIEGVDPTTAPAQVIETYPELSCSIVTTVTAFFSSKDIVNEENQMPAPVHPIRQLLSEIDNANVTLILGHHPADWFTSQTSEQMTALFVQNNAIYLHGHEHRVRADFGRKGLTSVGFGAAYQASLGQQTQPYYRNSFAICELHDSLHVAFFAWDAVNGRWTPDQTLPANFDQESSILEHGIVLPLPTTPLRDGRSSGSLGPPSLVPLTSYLEGCYWLATDHQSRWLKIIQEFGFVHTVEAYSPSTLSLAEGHTEIRFKDKGMHRLIHAVSAHGDIVSYEQVVMLNTQLDTDTLSGCMVITLGDVADEARTLVNRLGQTKQLSLLDNQDFVRHWLLHSTSPLVSIVKSLDNSIAIAELLITNDGYGLLISDGQANRWFQIVGENREVLEEADPLVFEVREALPIMNDLAYRSETVASDTIAIGRRSGLCQDKSFDKSKYLETSYQLFDEVRYAPLAALGFRFQNASLSEIYVPTNASVDAETMATQSLESALSEYLESLDLSRTLREQLESQLRSHYGLGRSAEAGMARRLYQRYGNTVILGDPGSGKTCFVKHEILAYCRPPDDNGSWYRQHLPIYIPLAEAADLLRTETNFLSVCTVVLARRKLRLPEAVIASFLSRGRTAFFFDGLDEVGRLDERVNLLDKIDQLIAKFARFGNRFVLTSRPSAVQPVDIPDAFTYLQLKGLTDQEIRVLAERVLTSRLGNSTEQALQAQERALVERLLEQVKKTPGLRRISRNPLLLTLLVLIYANRGALSAHRHVVYTQAVKTLVSVRHREGQEQPLSEVDLRSRLGRLALAIFRREINELPSRDDVLQVFQEAASEDKARQRSADRSIELSDPNEFLRRVAEATGLLVIHSREGGTTGSADIVSFMHHSFLEYYAAVGLLARDFEKEVYGLATHPHWRDVITLMFGLWSEYQDITPLTDRLFHEAKELDPLTGETLFVALECALECDVPPQGTQIILAQQLEVALMSGALKYSEQLRTSAARLVGQLIDSAGMDQFAPMLLNGMQSSDVVAAAAFIDFMGRLETSGRLPVSLVDQFHVCFMGRRETVIRSACIGALARRADLRSDDALTQLQRAFSSNLAEKHAALRALDAVPALIRRFVPALVELLEDNSPLISSTASRCILMAGVTSQELITLEPGILKAISRWQTSGQPAPVNRLSLCLDKSALVERLGSDEPAKVAGGAALLPLADVDDGEVHKLLMNTMREHSDHFVKRACLDSLRLRRSALELVTLAETDYICGLVKSQYRDVRIAALRILGMLPNDEQVISTLRKCCGMDSCPATQKRDLEEDYEAIRALAEHARTDVGLQQDIANAVLSSLPQPDARQFGDDRRQRHRRNLLAACESVGAIVEEQLSRRLLSIATNYRSPHTLRIQALRVYGRTMLPSVNGVRKLTELVNRNEQPVNDATYAACYWFLVQCRKRVEYVRTVAGEVAELKDALLAAWHRETSRRPTSIDPVAIGDIRRALNELEGLLNSHKEFSERMKLADNEQKGNS